MCEVIIGQEYFEKFEEINDKYLPDYGEGNHVALCKEGRAGMARIVDSKVGDDNLLGKRVRIRKRYSNLDGTIGTIYSYEGTNYDDEVEVERNGHIYKVDYEDIEFLDSKVKDEQMFEDGKMQDNWINYKVLKELKYDIYKAISQNWETIFSDEFFYEDSFSLEQSYSNKNQLVVNFKPRKEVYFKWEYDFEQFKAGLKTIPNLKLKSIHKKSVMFDNTRFTEVDKIVFQYIGQITDSIREDIKVKDNDELWFEILLKRALKENEKEFSSDISPMVANRVAKKYGVKIAYIRNGKEYYYKYTYIINESKTQDDETIEYKGVKIGVLHTGVGKLYEVRYNKNRVDWPEYYKLENAKKYIDILLTKGEQAANASWETAEGENRSYQPDILLDDILSWFEDHEQAKEDLIIYLKNNKYTDEDIKDLFGIVEESLNESSKANYNIEYYRNSATADRRPSTAEDVEEDYIYDTIQASNDLEALEEAFYIQTGEDYYEEIFDDYGAEDTVEGFKDYFDSTDLGDGSIIICKITQGSRVIYDSGLNKQYFLDEVDEEWEDIEEDYKKSKYSLSEIEDAVSTSFGFNKKETKDYIKKSSPEVLDALVAGFKAEASKSFLTDDLKKKEPEIKLEGEAVFTKKNGTPGYLVKDGGKIKFLRNYTEDQVKKLGFTVKN